jgi:hypothetical protein
VKKVGYEKDPEEVLDYGFDYSGWMPSGDSILNSTWTVDAGLTSASPTISGTQTSIVLSGGTLDTTYEVKNKIVTTPGGRTAVRRVSITVVKR